MSTIHRISPTGPAEAAYVANALTSTDLSTAITLNDPISKTWALTDKSSNSNSTLDLSHQDYTHFDIQDYSPHFLALDLSYNKDLFINSLNTLTNLPLQSLFLHGIDNGQQQIITHLTTSPSSCLNETLSTLDLSEYFIPNKQLHSLTSALPKLTKLGVHNCNLHDYALNTLLKNPLSKLKYIDASKNKIKQLTMLESWTPLPTKPLSPKKLSKQFSFSHLSLNDWIVNIGPHQTFQPPMNQDRPSFLLDLRENPLSSDTFEVLKQRFNQVVYPTLDNPFFVFYNIETQTYILTDLPQLENLSWLKA